MDQIQIPADVNLVLIGITGTGKSATGNSILNERAFESRAGTTLVTQKTGVGESRYEDGRRIRVVDTPGVCNPESRDPISTQMKRAMNNAMDYCGTGYHAVLLVFRYGVISRENRYMIETLPEIFGQNFMKDYCIIIVTHGGIFEREMEETGDTFETWWSQQNASFQDLLQRCGNRILLFDNKTKDKAKQDKQRQQLLDMVINFQVSSGKRLTKQRYESALVPPQGSTCPVQ